MTSLHILSQDNQIEMQNDLSGYVLPLVLTSHDTNGTVNGSWQ